MDKNHVLGMICGYYLSRFDQLAYENLGHGTQQATHEALGNALGVPAESIKNWRDEFDPIHDNPRQGWHKREMYPSRRRTMEALGHLPESELLGLIHQVVAEPAGKVASDVVHALGGTQDDDRNGEQTIGLRGPTGVKAEEEFARFHEQKGEPVEGELLDRRYDQCGYDYEIVTATGRVCVEVKGLAGSSGGVTFTAKEWAIAKQVGDGYFLAIVRNVAADAEVSLIMNPAARLSARMRTYTTVQTGWSVNQGEIRAAESEVND
jgi:hypothetical protein